MAMTIVEELWTRIRAAIDDKIVAAEDAAVRAEGVADSTHWQDDRLSVMGQLGPSLKGPKGDKGDKGDSGDGAGDVLWSELNPVLDGKAPVSHDHTIGQVTGLQSALDGKADKSDATVSMVAGKTVQREPDSSNIRVSEVPQQSYHATARSYVDTEVGKKSDASRVTALEGSQPIIVSSMDPSPMPGRIYLVTG